VTVKDLLELLIRFDPSLLVVLQKDAEGNGYSPCAGGEPAYYVADSTYSGAVYGKEDIENGEAPSGGAEAFILWPVN